MIVAKTRWSIEPQSLRARLEALGADFTTPEIGDDYVPAPPSDSQMSPAQAKNTLRSIAQMLDLFPSSGAVTMYVNDGTLRLMARGLRRAKVFDCMRHRRAAEHGSY